MNEPTKEQIEAAAVSMAESSQLSCGTQFHWRYTTEAIRNRWRKRSEAALRAALEVNVENTENSTGEKVCLSAGDNKNACPSDLPENEKQTDGLLPCPFCGGESILRTSETIYSTEFMVMCGNFKGECGVNTQWQEASEEAARVWNTRHTQEFTDEEIEAAAVVIQWETGLYMSNSRSVARAALQAFAAVRMKGEG